MYFSSLTTSVPICCHSWYSTDPWNPFTHTIAEYAGTFPIVVPNGNHMRYAAPVGTDEEDKLADAAKQIRNINPQAFLLFYLNTMMDWNQFDLHREKHKLIVYVIPLSTA